MNVAQNELTLIYNSSNIQDRKALAYAVSLKNRTVKTIDVQDNPLTKTQLKSIANRLDVDPDQLVDKHSTMYLRYYTNMDLSEKDTLKALKQSQAMLRTPIILEKNEGYFVNNFKQLVEMNLDFKRQDKAP